MYIKSWVSQLRLRLTFFTLIFACSDLLDILTKLAGSWVFHNFLYFWKLFWRKAISLWLDSSHFYYQLFLFLLKSVEVDRVLKFIIPFVKLSFIGKKALKNSICKLNKYFRFFSFRNWYWGNSCLDNVIVQRFLCFVLALNIEFGLLRLSSLPNLSQSLRIMIEKS